MPENCQAWQYKYWRRAWTSYFGYPTTHIDSMIHQQDSSIGRGTCLCWRLHCFHMYSPCISRWMIPNKRWVAQVSGRLWKDLLHPFLQYVDSNYILIGWKNRQRQQFGTCQRIIWTYSTCQMFPRNFPMMVLIKGNQWKSMVNKPFIRPYFPKDGFFGSASSRVCSRRADFATKRHTFQCLSQVSDTSTMEEIFVNLRIHGTSMHWSQDKLSRLTPRKMHSQQWRCWFRSRLKYLQANQGQSHIGLYYLTPFSSSFTYFLNQMLHETRIISSINTRQGPDLLQSKSPLSFSHLKLGNKLPLVSKHSATEEWKQLPRIARLLRCHASFASTILFFLMGEGELEMDFWPMTQWPPNSCFF